MLKLSVIVPFHDVRPYAPDALRSLRANARDDVEFLLVDDCSSDGTADLLDRAERELPGAVLIRHERNRGLASARNSGIDRARGEYLAFLDGDDWLAPGHCGRLLAAAERLGVDFLRTDHVRCAGRDRTVVRVPHGRRNVAMSPREAILPAHRTTSVDYAYAWAGVYHRRLAERGVLRFVDGLRTAEDRPWIWRLHREAESFAVTGLLGVYYRRGVATSLTRIGDERRLDFVPAYDRIVAETAADPDADRLLPKAVRSYCAVLAHHLGAIAEFEPAVARRLREVSARALARLPQDVLDGALASMDAGRAARLRALRRRGVAGPGPGAGRGPGAGPGTAGAGAGAGASGPGPGMPGTGPWASDAGPRMPGAGPWASDAGAGTPGAGSGTPSGGAGTPDGGAGTPSGGAGTRDEGAGTPDAGAGA
ncbi:glycosyltransferase family 2 protein [Streptomyces sp. SHP 1-2]|nr:glycosyltransferase family 2 protein [Streptomyces sp. SHP 1-2]